MNLPITPKEATFDSRQLEQIAMIEKERENLLHNVKMLQKALMEEGYNVGANFAAHARKHWITAIELKKGRMEYFWDR